MLILTRKLNEQILIGDDVVIEVTALTGSRVSLGIAAPDSVKVMRRELTTAPDAVGMLLGETCRRHGCRGAIVSTRRGTLGCSLCKWPDKTPRRKASR